MQQQLVVTGKFLGAKPTQLVGQNNYAVRPFYLDLTDNPEYPNTPEFQLKGDKVNLVDNLTKGQMVQVKFNIDGRKYTNREGRDGVITNLNVWKIEVVQMQSAAVAPAPRAAAPAPVPTMSGPGQYSQQSAPAPVAAGVEHQGEGSDDLPF
jgi:hypothetical protein